MSVISNLWTNAKAIGKGVLDVFVGIVCVLVLTIWAIGYAIFSLFEHLYTWIDDTISEIKENLSGVQMVPPEDTETFIKELNKNHPKTKIPPYKPGTKRSLLVALGTDGKVKKAQVVSTERGFESAIEEAFKKGNIIDQPIDNE